MNAKLIQAYTYLKQHLPVVLAAVPVIVGALNLLVNNGYLNPSQDVLNLVNPVLVLLGVGVLHRRQQNGQ